jgi:hypothetical protein
MIPTQFYMQRHLPFEEALVPWSHPIRKAFLTNPLLFPKATPLRHQSPQSK